MNITNFLKRECTGVQDAELPSTNLRPSSIPAVAGLHSMRVSLEQSIDSCVISISLLRLFRDSLAYKL